MEQTISSFTSILQGPFEPRSTRNEIIFAKNQCNPSSGLKDMEFSRNLLPAGFELEKMIINQVLSRMHFPEFHPTPNRLLISPKTNAADNLTIRFDYQIYKDFRDHSGPNLDLKCYQNSSSSSQNVGGLPRKVRRAVSKNVQSKFKNTYGLIIGRVIKSCKEFWRFYMDQQNKENIDEIEDGRFQYIHDRVKAGGFDLNRFVDYLNDYYKRDPELKKKRGKIVVQEFLSQDIRNGLVLVELVQLFLDPKNADFQNYVCNDTKPKGQILKVLCDQQDLEKLREKFKEMEITLKEEYDRPCKKLKDEESI